ncbi:MAG: acetylglutamate kinase [Gemmatimonadales bacterium]
MTRVIKVGGRPQRDPAFPRAVASGWVSGPGGLVLVHGGGDEVSTLQGVLGGSTTFVDGRRVTTERDIDLVRMALSGSANKRLVATLVERGLDAVGLSGEDAALIAASPLDARRLGFVGLPDAVNVVFLRHLLSGGYLPVISPVSRDGSGTLGAALNVNGDDAATAIAIALGAAELLLVSDVPGVLCHGNVLAALTPAEARGLLSDGTAGGGMRTKLQAAAAAVEGGVPRVRISDIGAIADLTRGTVVALAKNLS